MKFNYAGYNLNFIQKCPCKDESDHLYTYIYKFFSPVTKYFYIVRAEYHREDTFAIKFYCKKDRKSRFKYSKIINKGDLGNIIMSCAKVIPQLLASHPNASFCFAAARSVDFKNKTIEDYRLTQRYKLYCNMIPQKFGFLTFEHFAYDEISCYLLRNKSANASKEGIENMLQQTYTYLDDFMI